MEKKIEGSLYVQESATWGGHFRYGPDTKCVKAECADLSIVEVVCLGKKEDIWKQLELVDYGTEKLNIRPEVFGTHKDYPRP